MSVIIIDSSSWISYFAGQEMTFVDTALKDGRVYLPALVIAELSSSRGLSPKKRSQLYSFLEQLPVCNTTFEHWKHVGELRATLLSKGYSISTPDAHIAQCALDYKAYLLSEDGIFKKVAALIGLKIAPSLMV